MRQVEIADYYGFDGWLINIENPIRPDHVPALQQFVQLLTLLMHSRRPDSQVCVPIGASSWIDKTADDNEKASARLLIPWQKLLLAADRVCMETSPHVLKPTGILPDTCMICPCR